MDEHHDINGNEDYVKPSDVTKVEGYNRGTMETVRGHSNDSNGEDTSESVKDSLLLSYMSLPDQGPRSIPPGLKSLHLMMSQNQQNKDPDVEMEEHRHDDKPRKKTTHVSDLTGGKKKRSNFDGNCVVAIPTKVHEQWTGILEALIYVRASQDFMAYTSPILTTQRGKNVVFSDSKRGVTLPAVVTTKKPVTQRMVLIPKAVHKQWCMILEDLKSLLKDTDKKKTDKKEGTRTHSDDTLLPDTVFTQLSQSIDRSDLIMTSDNSEKYKTALTTVQAPPKPLDRREVRKSIIPKMDVKEEIEIPVPETICTEWSKLIALCKLQSYTKFKTDTVSKSQGRRMTTYADSPVKKVGNQDNTVEEHLLKPTNTEDKTDCNESTAAMVTITESIYNDWCKLLDAYDVMVTSLGFKQCRVSLPKLPELEESEDDVSEEGVEGAKLKKIILIPKLLHDNWFRVLDSWNWLAESMGYDDGQTTAVPKLQLLRMHKSTPMSKRDRICKSYIESSDEGVRFFLVPEVVFNSWISTAHKEWSNLLQTGHSIMMSHDYETHKSNQLRLQEFKDHVYGQQVSSKPTTTVEKVCQHWIKLKNTWNTMVTTLGYAQLTASIPNIPGVKALKESYAVEQDLLGNTDNMADAKTVIRLTRVSMRQYWDSELSAWTLMAIPSDIAMDCNIMPVTEVIQSSDSDELPSSANQYQSADMVILSKPNYKTWCEVLAKWNKMVASIGFANYQSSVLTDTRPVCPNKPPKYSKENPPEQGHLKGKFNRMIDSWNLIATPTQCQRGINPTPEVQMSKQSILARLPMTVGNHGSKPGQFSSPCGLIINSGHKMVVADKDNHRLQVVDWNGHCRVMTKANRFNKPFLPYDLAETSDGKYVITDVGNDQVVVCNEYDQIIRVFGQKERIKPRGITVTSNGVVMVTDVQQGRSCIRRYTLNGQHLGVFATYCGNQGQVHYPSSLAVNSQDDVIVPGNGSPDVQIYDQDGHLKTSFTTSASTVSPFGVDVDADDNIYVCDFWNDVIVKYTHDGQFVCDIGKGQVTGPLSVAVLSSCIIAVTQHHSHTIKVLDL